MFYSAEQVYAISSLEFETIWKYFYLLDIILKMHRS